MARPKSIGLRRILTSLFPTRQLNKVARETGAVVRQRKVKVQDLFWSIVLGFGAGAERTLAGMRQAYVAASHTTISPSGFYKRFTPGLSKMFQRLAGKAMDNVAKVRGQLEGAWAAFKDVLLTDSTVVCLKEILKPVWAGCRTNTAKAAAKLHVIMSVLGRGASSVKLTSERENDGRCLVVGSWVRGTLLLFDLGYYSFALFSRIAHHGGYFLSRLKDNANPTITALNRTWRGASVELVGQQLQWVLSRLQRQELDVEVKLKFPSKRKSKAKRRQRARRPGAAQCHFRLVGVMDPNLHEYHLFVTNIPVEVLSATAVARLYAARWGVELFFKMLKSCFRLDDLPSGKKPVVETLLFAALLTMVASERLHRALSAKLREELRPRVRNARWAKLFAGQAPLILHVLLGARAAVAALERAVEYLLFAEAVDPNASRLSLMQQVEMGVHAYRPKICATSH